MKTRVCMISPQFYPVIGGTEKQAESLALALQQRGDQVIILTQEISARNPGEKVLSGEDSVQGLKVYRQIKGEGLRYIFSTVAFLWKKRKEYDLIHCHLLYLQVVAAVIIGKLLQKPVLVKVACSGEWGDVARMKKMSQAAFLLETCRQADKFISLSGEIRKELETVKVPAARIIDYHNFVDTSVYFPVDSRKKISLRENLDLPIGEKLVVFSGRLEQQKGLDCLAESWQQVCRLDSGAVLLIIGDGSLYEPTVSRLSAESKKGRVKFIRAPKEVAPYLQASDLFVLPSESEGMSNALLEAMACGLPCVVSAIGGNRDLVEGGQDGVLVPPRDAKSLTEAIMGLINQPGKAEAMAAWAGKKVRENFSREAAVQKYLELYKELQN